MKLCYERIFFEKKDILFNIQKKCIIEIYKFQMFLRYIIYRIFL